MGNNIAKIRDGLGISQVELSRRLKLHVTTLNRIENAKSKPPLDRMEQIARELGVTVSDLLVDEEPAEVPVMGRVGAGGEVSPDYEQIPEEGLDQVRVPFPLPAEMIALEVTGTSMLPQFRDGTVLIVYREQRRATDSFLGEEAVVRTADGRRYIKTIIRGSRGYTLTSWNADPIENVKVVWVGEIFTYFPPGSLRRAAKQGGIQGRLALKA